MIKINFDFIVDKETCFAHWAQLLIRCYVWNQNDKEKNYYVELAGNFSELERNALTKFQEIISKNGDSLWVTSRYIGEEIKDSDEKKNWDFIRSNLNQKFEKVWSQEAPLLIRWEEILENYPLEKLIPVLEAAAHFWGVEYFEKEIKVKLLFYYGTNFVRGHSYRSIDDFVLLGISHTDIKRDIMAISTLIHEVTHLFENKSPISKDVFHNFARFMSGAGVEKPKPGMKPSWRDLFNECIIKSVAGGYREDYVYRTIIQNKAEFSYPKEEFDFKAAKSDYNLQAGWVATNILDMTEEYLNSSKQIDQPYAEAVAAVWFELRKRMESTLQ